MYTVTAYSTIGGNDQQVTVGQFQWDGTEPSVVWVPLYEGYEAEKMLEVVQDHNNHGRFVGPDEPLLFMSLLEYKFHGPYLIAGPLEGQAEPAPDGGTRVQRRK